MADIIATFCGFSEGIPYLTVHPLHARSALTAVAVTTLSLYSSYILFSHVSRVIYKLELFKEVILIYTL
jgi:hypothetical protein